MGDIVNFLLEMNEVRELRYELEINDKLFNDRETAGMQVSSFTGMRKTTHIMLICANSLLP